MPADATSKTAENAGTTLTFDNFAAGEFGSEAPWRAAPNSFTGNNIVRYVDGSLGPRNGLAQITLSGDAITGVVKGWGRQLATGGKFMWLIVNANTYLMSAAGAVKAMATAVALTPEEPPQSVPKGDFSYVSNIGDKLYKIDHLLQTNTAIAAPNSPGLRCLAQYGERTMAGGANSVGGSLGKAPDGTTAPFNRLYFSAASNPESWPAANYIDIGENSSDIKAIIPQRTHCVISMSDGSWWILTGVPGVNPVLRGSLRSVSPAFPSHAAQIGSGNIAYCIASSTTNGSTASLGEFTGSQITLNDKVNYGDGRIAAPHPTYTVVPLKNIDDWFVTGGPGVAANRAALHQRGAWTLHQWQVNGVTLYGFCTTAQTSADQHFFTDGGSAGVTPKFYQWRAYNNRPAFTSDTLMQPGDASTTPFTANFTLPEWADTGSGAGVDAGGGRELSVVAVTVDFTSWNTGSPSSNHFDLTVNTLRLWEAGSISTPHPTGFDEAGSRSSTAVAGTRQRRRFEFSGSPQGNGFSLDFTNLRGVAIQKIQVRLVLTGHRPFRQYDGQRD